MNLKHSQAYSLLDLILTMSLIAILTGTALPDFLAILEYNRINSLRNQFHAHIQQARALSVLKMKDMELCGSSDGRHCDDQWSLGWIVHSVKSSQVITHYQLDHKDVIRWAGATERIRFHSNGTTPLGNGRLFICNQDRMVVMQIVLNRQGRARLVAGLEKNQNQTIRC